MCLGCAGEELEGTVRLVGGAADPGGVWAYGRPQVFHSGAYSTLIKRFDFSLPRNSSQVVCRSLGYAGGAGIISVHTASAMPGDVGEVKFVDFVRCNGDEESTRDCDIGVNLETLSGPDPDFDAGAGGRYDVAVVCLNPSGVPSPSLPCVQQRIELLGQVHAIPPSPPQLHGHDPQFAVHARPVLSVHARTL